MVWFKANIRAVLTAVATVSIAPSEGRPQGRVGVTVRASRRVTFRFERGHAYDVDLEDYH